MSRVAIAATALALPAWGCGGDSPGLGDGTGDTDTDVDTDFDPDGPCSAEAEQVAEFADDMVVCESTVGPRAQWVAGGNCNDLAGWQLCTPEQYQARGGLDVGTEERAWIGGCVRDGGDVHAPTAGVCGEGDGGNGEVQDYIWDCDSNSGAGSSQLFLGIYSIDECHRLGDTDPVNEGMWGAGWTIGLRPAVCCE